MDKNKKALRHKLLNILTLANLLIEGEKVNVTKKEQILNLINLAALLIKYEDILCKKKQKLFQEKVNLKEILEIILLIHKEKITKNNINFIIPKEDFFIKGDQNSTKDGLELLISKLLNSVNRMEFQFNHPKNTLTISHEGKLKKALDKKEFCQGLNEKNLKSNDISLPLAWEILNINNIKLNSKNNIIIITFPI